MPNLQRAKGHNCKVSITEMLWIKNENRGVALMTDRYKMINHACCNNPRLQLIDEKSMGYDVFICCLRCNQHQGFDEEEEE